MQVFLLKPRGFCAGVKRAIEIVEGAIEKYPLPIYVYHEIVHNTYVVNHFVNKGVIFVESIHDVPNNATIIFSAHGVSAKVEQDAKTKNINIIDATCPLVKKVHRVAQKHDISNKKIILIGHRGHPEVIGTIGRVKSEVILIETESDVENLNLIESTDLAYITQTTLSVDETIGIIAKLKNKFPNIKSQDNSDICYATQNRQDAVKEFIHNVDILIVIGSKQSSNSNRLKDIGINSGKESYLINSYTEIDNIFLKRKGRNFKIALTSGASAPEILIQEVINHFRNYYSAKINEIEGVIENIEFHVPKEVRITTNSTLI